MDLKLKIKDKKTFSTVSISSEYKIMLKKYCKDNGFKMTQVIEALIDELNKEK